jgi:hypothetical protein
MAGNGKAASSQNKGKEGSRKRGRKIEDWYWDGIRGSGGGRVGMVWWLSGG